MRAISRRKHRQLRFSMAMAVVFPWSLGLAQDTAPVKHGDAWPISQRGPGMKGPSTDFLKLPVPRTFDLTHVAPRHFAAALGKDPQKIFEFVRDHVAYEVYPGCLRGPRGTLLAMAGNSVDRAALLASLLAESGQRVRFVHGPLPQDQARELVTSMWAKRPGPVLSRVAGGSSPTLKAALRTLETGVTRDYGLIRDQLKKMEKTLAPEPAVSLDSLFKETEDHWWLQWWKNGAWKDLDTSFADAAPGRTYTEGQTKSVDALPDRLFHRVAIRINLEEYTDSQPKRRVILSHTARAADLSGMDLVLTHQPENWKGPATGIAEAISLAAGDTGRVKPVLIVAEKSISGESFRQKPSTGQGLGGIGQMLAGTGTRHPVPTATAEHVEFDFIAPGGRTETVMREIFDIVGKDRRDSGKSLGEDEVRNRAQAGTVLDVTKAIYDLFFTTGRIDSAHLSALSTDQPRGEGEERDARAVLRRINITFVVGSDALLGRLDKAERAVILFYPDSPRLQMGELSSVSEKVRLAIDLRRDGARALAYGPHPEDVFSARVLRGVVDGTLERVLVELIRASAGEKTKWEPAFSTSSVFEKADKEGVLSILLTSEKNALSLRMRDDLGRGFVALAPKQAIAIDQVRRLAWWRIDLRTGETTAVTDEGLHQAVCYTQQESEGRTRVTVIYRSGMERVLTFSSDIGGLAMLARFLYFLAEHRIPFGG